MCQLCVQGGGMIQNDQIKDTIWIGLADLDLIYFFFKSTIFSPPLKCFTKDGIL